MLTTMSSSWPPSARAPLASASLIAVLWPPWGKPIVVLALTVLPASSSAHRLR